jgi:hypothetical protein
MNNYHINQLCHAVTTKQPQIYPPVTSTAALIIQSIFSKDVYTNYYTLMSSIDLTADFDLVDTRLLVKCLKITGLPSDII